MQELENSVKDLEALISKKADKNLIKEKCFQISNLCVSEQKKPTSDVVIKEKLNIVRLNAESIKKATAGMDFLGRSIAFDYEISKNAVEGMKIKIEEIKKL